MYTKNPIPADKNRTDLWRAAMAYVERGWSIIPTRADKRPAVAWKRWQRERADPATIARWLERADVTGIAICLGRVSGGVVCRDFDDIDAYRAWAATFPDLAKTLPTALTARGAHVYFRVDDSQLRPVTFPDGEYRATGQFTILPPSIHPTGHVYRWTVELPTTGELPMIPDPDAVGLRHSVSRIEIERERGRETENGSLSLSQLSTSIIGFESTLPKHPGERNACIFRLCRLLKALPEFADATAATLRRVVREWHARALPYIATPHFDDSVADFFHGWARVRFPDGKGVADLALLRADARISAGTVPGRIGELYSRPQLIRLATLCIELQRAAGDGPFFLAASTAARLLAENPPSVGRWLGMLTADGVLSVAEKPTATRATRYRAAPDLLQ